MSRFRSWLANLPHTRYVPLFKTTGELVVETRVRGAGRRLLCRSPEMEQAIVETVAAGLEDDTWTGLLYIMAWGRRDRLRPLYIGRAGRYGKKNRAKLSANLAKLATDTSKFARWGDGSAYHIGDLSQALFGWSAYKQPGQKYERWAEMLFLDRERPLLREPTHLLVVPWHQGQRGCAGWVCTLEEAEEQAIDLALEEFEDVVLNVQGETWWAPAASTRARPPGEQVPRRPYEFVASAEDLTRVARMLTREKLVGLDVETTLYSQELRLVQISTRTHTHIFDPLALPSLEPLRPVLERSGPTKVIHNASFERRILGEVGFDVAEVFDSLRVSRRLGPKTCSHRLAAVCERYLGRGLDKSSQTSDWSRRPLTRAQLEYAAADAEVLLDLHDALVPLVGREPTLFEHPTA